MRKRLKFFSPKLSPLIPCSGKLVCWELGEPKLRGEREEAISTSSCLFYISTKERATGTAGMNQASHLSLKPCQCRAGFPSPGTLSCTAEQQHTWSLSTWKRCCWQGLWGLASGAKMTPPKSVGATLWGQGTETHELAGQIFQL